MAERESRKKGRWEGKRKIERNLCCSQVYFPHACKSQELCLDLPSWGQEPKGLGRHLPAGRMSRKLGPPEGSHSAGVPRDAVTHCPRLAARDIFTELLLEQ